MKMDRQPHKSAYMACLITALLISATPLYAATSETEALSIESTTAPRSLTGKFFGYDQKTREVWINDFVYILRADCRVVGSSTKLGLLSAIKHQEVVEFKTAPNPKQPSIPYIAEIRRK